MFKRVFMKISLGNERRRTDRCAVFVDVGYAITISGRLIAMASSSGKGSLKPSEIIGMITDEKLPASIMSGLVWLVMRRVSSLLIASAARLR